MSPKLIQVPKYWNLAQLRDFLIRYMRVSLIQMDVVDMQIWKMHSFLTDVQIRSQIVAAIQSENYVLSGQPITQAAYSQIPFLKQFIKDQYTLAVEVLDHDQKNFYFNSECTTKAAGRPAAFKGLCESCFKEESLVLKCRCAHVYYCSPECKYEDQIHHSAVCELAFDSDTEDEGGEEGACTGDQSQPKEKQSLAPTSLTFAEKEHVGLKNIGNTCYMNATLQCLANTLFFQEYYASGSFKAELKSADKKSHILTDKFSLLLRALNPRHKPAAVSPWSFRNQFQWLNKNVSLLPLLQRPLALLRSHARAEFLKIMFTSFSARRGG